MKSIPPSADWVSIKNYAPNERLRGLLTFLDESESAIDQATRRLKEANDRLEKSLKK